MTLKYSEVSSNCRFKWKAFCRKTLTFNSSHATGLFLYLLKTSENQSVSDVFRGYRKKPVAENGLKNYLNYFWITCIIKNYTDYWWKKKVINGKIPCRFCNSYTPFLLLVIILISWMSLGERHFQESFQKSFHCKWNHFEIPLKRYIFNKLTGMIMTWQLFFARYCVKRGRFFRNVMRRASSREVLENCE